MKTVVCFNLAKIGAKDALHFKALHDAFAAHGFQFILFTPANHELLRKFSRPFHWTILEIAKMVDLSRVAGRTPLPKGERQKWCDRISRLSLQHHTGDVELLYNILEKFAFYVLNTYSPSLILSWNTLCPHSGVLADIARAEGVKVWLIERGFLPDAWFIESGGLVGHSSIVEASFEDLVPPERFDLLEKIGRSYLEVRPFDGMSRYVQNQNTRFAALVAGSRRASRPIVGFLPPDDLSLGFSPPDHDDRIRHLPDYPTSFEAATALAAACPEIDVIFKPHPSFREQQFPDRVGENLFVVDHDYRELIQAADAIASTGSGLVFPAMASGKPVIQMNRDQLSGKGITYETAGGIREAVSAALDRRDFEPRQSRFRAFLGYALTQYLSSAPDADTGFQTPAKLVRRIAYQEFGIPAVADRRLLAPQHAATGLSRDRIELLERIEHDIARPSDTRYIVDFDHTLLFANSTELYLEGVRPRVFATAAYWLLSALVPFRALAKSGIQRNQVFDPLRVVLTSLLAGWALIGWWLRPRRAIAGRVNSVLLDAVKRLGPTRVTIVSLGHPWLVRPLLRAMGLRHFELICGNTLPTATDIRRIGKFAALARRSAKFVPSRTLAVSDAIEDEELLTNVRRGWLIDWHDRKDKFDPLTRYFPFVLTAEGKYFRAGVVRRHRFQEDLPVLAAVFIGALAAALWPEAPWAAVGDGAPSLVAAAAIAGYLLAGLASLFCFFVSFNAVYEIGYWENDFVASAREEKPAVNPGMERFRHYPIKDAWSWGLGLGAIGALIAVLAGLPSHFDAVVETWLPGLAPLPAGARPAIVFALDFVAWAIVLVIQRRLFKLHNEIRPRLRIYTFWMLHAFKLTAYAAIFAMTLSGALVVIAQVFRHWTHYLVYRFNGEKAAAPKGSIALFYFIAYSALVAVVVPARALFDATWALGAAFLIVKSGELGAFGAAIRRAFRRLAPSASPGAPVAAASAGSDPDK